MPTFRLWSDDARSIIAPYDVEPPYGFSARSGLVSAPDWLAAKAALGFDLTPLQAELAPLDNAARLDVVRREKWQALGRR